MDRPRAGNHKSSRALLWVARIISAVLVVFILLFVIGYAIKPKGESASTSETVGLTFFLIGVCGGLLVGWRWPMLGGIVSLGCLATFLLWLVVVGGDRGIPPPFLVFAIPAILYIVQGVSARRGETGVSSSE